MQKVTSLVNQCKASGGVRIKKGETVEVSDGDAYYLIGRGLCEAANEKNKKEKPAKGLSTKNSGSLK